jgi:diguanylate cyclase (GGDEF)-like protein
MVREATLSAVLSEFAQTMVTDFPIQSILDRLVERIVGVLPIDAAGVTLISPGAAPRYVAASDGSALRFERLQTQIGEGPCLLAYETGVAVTVPDLAADRRFPEFSRAATDAGLVAVFTFPLRHGEGRLGALDLYRNRTGPLSAPDMVAAQTLADVAASYLINAQARDQDREESRRAVALSLHDSLTGLPNRVLFFQMLEHAASRARRSGSSAAVLFADLDRFKDVNDTYGHQVGDHALVAVGRRLLELVRPGDTLARIAGDEFVFLCEDINSIAVAEQLAERITAAMAEPFVLEAATVTIGASVGIAFAGKAVDITSQLVVDADSAMYRMKERAGGRDHGPAGQVANAEAVGTL